MVSDAAIGQKRWHGSQQGTISLSLLGPACDGLTLPWVPDVLGSQWNHEKSVHIVGSAYAGFLQGISKRSFPFDAYLDLPPFLAQKVKTQNSANGEFESWGCRAGSSRKSLRLPHCGR
jgi:hypothetical protein